MQAPPKRIQNRLSSGWFSLGHPRRESRVTEAQVVAILRESEVRFVLSTARYNQMAADLLVANLLRELLNRPTRKSTFSSRRVRESRDCGRSTPTRTRRMKYTAKRLAWLLAPRRTARRSPHDGRWSAGEQATVPRFLSLRGTRLRFVKTDAQRHELEVLPSGTRLIAEQHAAFLVEVAERHCVMAPQR